MSLAIQVYRRSGRRYFEAQWVDPVTGKKRTKSTRKDRRRDAERVAARLAVDIESGDIQENHRITWEKFRKEYEEDVFPGQAKSTQVKTSCTFNAIEALVGPKMLASIDEEQVRKFVRKLRKLKKKRAEATVKSHLSELRKVLNWAYRNRLLLRVPQITMPSGVSSMKGRPITTEEFERMLSAVPKIVGKKFQASWIYLLKGFWWSGLRLAEAPLLHWSDDRDLTVDFSGRRPMFRIKAHAEKAKKNRILPMAPEFAEFLNQTPEKDRMGFIFNPEHSRRPETRIKADRISKVIVEIGELSGVKVAEHATDRDRVKFASAHDLRRAFGFRWAMRVLPPVLQELMRHEDINTTMKFYVGRNAEVTANAAWDAYETSLANAFANTMKSEPGIGLPEVAETPKK